MMNKTRIKPMELADNAIKIIAQDWMLITAGTAEKFNTMTASWGGVGYLWNKPVVFVFVRPERYTYDFIEANDRLSLTFFSKEYKDILSTLGTVSGRDMDKMNNSGLTPYFSERGTPIFEEARIAIECKKMYSSMLDSECFIDNSLMDKWYSAPSGLHRMYVAEIEDVWVVEK